MSASKDRRNLNSVEPVYAGQSWHAAKLTHIVGDEGAVVCHTGVRYERLWPERIRRVLVGQPIEGEAAHGQRHGDPAMAGMGA